MKKLEAAALLVLIPIMLAACAHQAGAFNRSGRLESIWSVRREVRISVEKSACLDVSL